MAWSEKWRIEYDTLPYRFNLECLADFQLGSRSCCEWKIKQHIDDILESAKHVDSGVIFAGDIEDEDRPSTRAMRAHVAAERKEVVERDAMKHMAWIDQKVIPLLLPLHEKTKYGVMGGVAGHHFTQLAEELNSAQYIFRRLQDITGKPCVYLGEMVSFLDLTFVEKTTKKGGQYEKSNRIVGLLQHGEGGGATKAATLTKLERAAQGFDADFFIRGHDCQLLGMKTDQLYARASRQGGEPAILSRTRASLNLGSATLGYEETRKSPSYIESAMMRPSTMGWGRLKFRVRRSLLAEDSNQNRRVDIRVEF